MEQETMVIEGRLHIQGGDGLFRRVPLGMDDVRSKEEHPVYRLEDGKPVKVEHEVDGAQDFADAVASMPESGNGLTR